ncbi:MAG: OmpA family protein [Alphaproteobacteria bacterium]|nr:OmpA family protein [Alphaproteobacteria bacterium]
MTNKVLSRFLVVASLVSLIGCAGTENTYDNENVATPTVDYVEGLDVNTAPHKDSFLNQLAMNYRSYAIYNARTSGFPEMGELFANKAVAAFSGETPFPETVSNWALDSQDANVLEMAYSDMINEFKNDATDNQPEVAAEAQAKFDCWLSATSTGQTDTAEQCRERFVAAMDVLQNCKRGGCKVGKKSGAGKAFKSDKQSMAAMESQSSSIEIENHAFYPETRSFKSMGGKGYPRDGIVIVNNISIPEGAGNLVKTEQVPMVFTQNIYGGDKSVSNSGNTVAVNNSGRGCNCNEETGEGCPCDPALGDDVVTRDEFINMMMAMRAEIKAINDRLDNLKPNDEKAVIKVQQIPLEPTQHVMEEIFEVHFDFNKAVIKPEYDKLIRELATATQNNKNIKVSVVGHTDTSGTKSYNYALGGRRAEAVQKMLINYGIPASQIVAVSAGEEDLKVQTADGVPNAENRRVRVVKETHYTEPGKVVPIAVVEEGTTADLGEECLDCGK